MIYTQKLMLIDTSDLNEYTSSWDAKMNIRTHKFLKSSIELAKYCRLIDNYMRVANGYIVSVTSETERAREFETWFATLDFYKIPLIPINY